MEKLKAQLAALVEKMARPQPLPVLLADMKQERALRAALFNEPWARIYGEAA